MADWRAHIRPHLAALRLSTTRENESIDELAQHLDDRWRELIAGGASAEEATRLALSQLREDVLVRNLAPSRQSQQSPTVTPGVSTGYWPSDLWRDLRYAAQMIRKHPGFAAAAILTLARGIGATTAIFSVIYGVLLQPLPFPEPDRLVAMWHTAPELGFDAFQQSPATYFTYRDEGRVFEDAACGCRFQMSRSRAAVSLNASRRRTSPMARSRRESFALDPHLPTMASSSSGIGHGCSEDEGVACFGSQRRRVRLNPSISLWSTTLSATQHYWAQCVGAAGSTCGWSAWPPAITS